MTRQEQSAFNVMKRVRWVVAGWLLLANGSVAWANDYTNHAGNVVLGTPTALTATTVTLTAAAGERVYPLSIFPVREQRRIAADFGRPRLPPDVRAALAGIDQAVARSQTRAAKGLCSVAESQAFCRKSADARAAYLDRAEAAGTILPAERLALERATVNR